MTFVIEYAPTTVPVATTADEPSITASALPQKLKSGILILRLCRNCGQWGDEQSLLMRLHNCFPILWVHVGEHYAEHIIDTIQKDGVNDIWFVLNVRHCY